MQPIASANNGEVLPKGLDEMNSVVLQLVFNALVSGLLLALLAAGFNLIYNTNKVFHIAHGGFYVAGAYAFYWIFQQVEFYGFMASVLATLVSFGAIAILALSVEVFIYQPLFRKKSGQAITLISSMGVYLFMVNTLALLFGNETIILELPIFRNINFENFIIAPVQQLQLLTALICLACLLVVSRSGWFLGVRAMMANESVASVLGVDTGKIRLVSIIFGSFLAAVSAILILFDTGIDPQAGLGITLSAAVAVIIGGSMSLRGTILASLLITQLQAATAWFLSAQWKEGVTFALLILVFFWRTEGIVSYKMRVEEQ